MVFPIRSCQSITVSTYQEFRTGSEIAGMNSVDYGKAVYEMDEWELYEDNPDMLTDELINAVKAGDRVAEWRLILIFKSEIIKACSKMAQTLHAEFQRPNNGPEPDWMVKMEEELVKGYRTTFKLDYWDDMVLRLKPDEVKGGIDNE